MAAVAVTNLLIAGLPGLPEGYRWISGTVAGAGTATIAHGCGFLPRGAFVQPNAASGTVTANVSDIDDENVVIEISAACNIIVLLLPDARGFIQIG